MNFKHGHATGYKETRTYRSWEAMIRRCVKIQDCRYSDYGGRGITVDINWIKDFRNFLADMGECPSGYVLDRIDNNKGYYLDNCRWTSYAISGFNKRKYTNNKSGIAGVCFITTRRRWVAQAPNRLCLYTGKDFFEACCARKSWEAKSGQEL